MNILICVQKARCWTGINPATRPIALQLDKRWQSTKRPGGGGDVSKSPAAAFRSCEKRLRGSRFLSVCCRVDVYYASLHSCCLWKKKGTEFFKQVCVSWGHFDPDSYTSPSVVNIYRGKMFLRGTAVLYHDNYFSCGVNLQPAGKVLFFLPFFSFCFFLLQLWVWK